MGEVKSAVIIDGRGLFPLASLNSSVCRKSLSLCHFEEATVAVRVMKERKRAGKEESTE